MKKLNFIIVMIMFIVLLLVPVSFADSTNIQYGTINRAPRFSINVNNSKYIEIVLKDNNKIKNVNLTCNGKLLINNNISQNDSVTYIQDIIKIDKKIIGKKNGDKADFNIVLSDNTKDKSNVLKADFTIIVKNKEYKVNNSPRISFSISNSTLIATVKDKSGLNELQYLTKDGNIIKTINISGSKSKNTKIDLSSFSDSKNLNGDIEFIAKYSDKTGKTRTENIVLRVKNDSSLKLNTEIVTVNDMSAYTKQLGGGYNTYQLNAVLNGKGLDSSDIIWTSNDPYIAKVDKNGLVTGNFIGTTKIIAKVKNSPSIVAECKVTVIGSLAEKVCFKKECTVKILGTNDTITVNKNTTAISDTTIRNINKKKCSYARMKILSGAHQGKYIRIETSAVANKGILKFLNYYIPTYSDKVMTAYINNTSITSKTNKLVWVSTGSQRLYEFKGKKGNWILEKSYSIGTGDSEGKYTSSAKGCITPCGFNYYLGSYKDPDSSMKLIDTYKSSGKRLANPIHQKAGNRTLGHPVSHGCPNIQYSNLKWLLNNVPLKSRIVYF